MAKLLILQHSESCPPGTTLEWCQFHQLEPVILKVWLHQDWPADMKDFLGVVICGGGMNVDQEALHPWLSKEKLFIKNLLDQKIKTLGLCLGAQIMAEVLGAKVAPHTHWEVGWHPVDLAPHAFIPSTPQKLMTFQWHGYTFETPTQTTKLGSSAGCANQGFVYGMHGLAFQFHPESDKAWIKECADSNDEEYPSGPFVESREQILQKLPQQEQLQQWYWKVLDAFFAPPA